MSKYSHFMETYQQAGTKRLHATDDNDGSYKRRNDRNEFNSEDQERRDGEVDEWVPPED